MGGRSNLGNVGIGRAHDQLAKWQYPQQQGNKTQSQNKNQGGVRQHNGYFPDLDDETSELYNWFGTGAGFKGETSFEEAILGKSTGVANHKDYVYDPKSGQYVFNGEVAQEPADPNFGVTSLLEDTTQEEGQDPVGKQLGEPVNLDDQSFTDPGYEYVASVHGTEVADAWYSISTEMSTLEGKDELNEELIIDMLGLTSEEGQLKIFTSIFHLLSSRNQSKVETFGMSG